MEENTSCVLASRQDPEATNPPLFPVRLWLAGFVGALLQIKISTHLPVPDCRSGGAQATRRFSSLSPLPSPGKSLGSPSSSCPAPSMGAPSQVSAAWLLHAATPGVRSKRCWSNGSAHGGDEEPARYSVRSLGRQDRAHRQLCRPLKLRRWEPRSSRVGSLCG